MQNFKIKDGSVVSCTCTITEIQTENVLEEHTENNPLIFTVGEVEILPVLESKLIGLEEGEEFNFIMSPEDFLGDHKPNVEDTLPIEMFNEDGVLDTELIKIGAVIPLTKGGERLFGTILDITDTVVKVDLNHPLTGKTLQVTGQILFVN